MAEYANRERQKFNDLGNQLGGIVTALAAADSATKAATLDRQIQILGMDNLKATAKTSIINHASPLEVHYDVPAAVISDMRSLVINEAVIDTTMNVNASTEDNLNIKSDTSVGGEGSIGFGMFKATAKFSSTVGVDKSIRRKSDYSSSLQINIRMGQSDAPEGIMRIIDSMNEVVKTATDLNTAIMVQNQPNVQQIQGSTAPSGASGATPAAN